MVLDHDLQPLVPFIAEQPELLLVELPQALVHAMDPLDLSAVRRVQLLGLLFKLRRGRWVGCREHKLVHSRPGGGGGGGEDGALRSLHLFCSVLFQGGWGCSVIPKL